MEGLRVGGHAAALRRVFSTETVSAFLRAHWAFMAATLPFVAYWAHVFSAYRVLPDALFGGDMWQQFGIVMHVWSGHVPWSDSQFVGEWAFRDWLMYALVAGLARVTFTDPLTVAIHWPILPLVAGAACVYAMGLRFFDQRALAVLMAVGWMGLHAYVDFKSSSFARMFTVPFFMLVLVTQDGSVKRRVLLGVAFGLAALSYVVAFFGLALLLVLVFAYRALGRPFLGRAESGLRLATRVPFRDAWRAQVRWFTPVALAAAPVVLALWGPLLLVYHGDVKNPSHYYADGARGWDVATSLGVFRGLFLDWSRPLALPVSLLTAFGVYASFRQWSTRGGKYAILVLVTGLLGSFHWLVTMPLFDNHLVYFRYPKVFLGLAALLLAFQGISFLARDRLARAWRPGVLVAAAVLVATPAAAYTPSFTAPHEAAARVDDAYTAAMLEGAAWATAEEDAVFLALDHESFALNGLSGAKIVTQRRSHANTFVDMDERTADAAVMLFSPDREAARALMDAYGVTHAYVGWFWDANLADHPIVTSREHAEYWRAHGLEFTETMAAYDPAGDAQLFPVIQLQPPAEDPPFLQDFTVVKEITVDGEAWMTFHARKDA